MSAAERTLTARFAAQVAAGPDRPAVVTPEHRWTYRELDAHADRVAGALAGAGVRQGGRCGLLFRHGAPMVPAVLGAMRAGLAYVPLDAAYPADRLELMLADSGAEVLLTDAADADLAVRLADGRPVLDVTGDLPVAPGPPLRVRPEDPAYVLYTSGSTGRPKPVVQLHRNVVHHADAWIGGLGVTAADRLSLQSAYSWDSAVQDMFAALLSGAALYPVDLKALGVAGLVDWMLTERISVYHSTLPIFRAVCRVLADRDAVMPSVRMLALGGDHIHREDLAAYRRWFADDCRLASAYGSTECSCALLRVVDKAYEPPTGVLPLGAPVPETIVELLGGADVGELIVRSPYLAPGHGRPAPDDDPDSYRTGDLGRRLPDGSVVLEGRADFQIKISGIRVEAGEVESALTAHPAIREAVVGTFADAFGERQLAAYLVAEPGATVEAVRAHLTARLPAHAVPTAYVFLDALPLTVNHKIDRAALPDPGVARARLATAYARPDGAAERAIAGAWAEILGTDAVGADDNFFDRGGTSLRMAALHERLTRLFDRPVRMVDLYRAPTVRGMARLVGEHGPALSAVTTAARRGAARREAYAATAARVARRGRPQPPPRGLPASPREDR
ncbi:non-ribosomal peptide synthetase [Actinoplanes sp. NPDC049548]|uniref:non-ribosomal peptide synthetase n=1 Tax=Actinoplanes sp. NPDC049548 TaxID=3155152 RepID=UPI003443EF8E